MRCPVRTRIKGTDAYLGRTLADVPREKAVIESLEKAKTRAARRFGLNWENHVDIEELSPSEYMGILGKEGGSRLTPKKKRALKMISNRRHRLRIFIGQFDGEQFAIGARHAREAADELEKMGHGPCYWTIYRQWKQQFRWPWKNDHELRAGIWQKKNGDWKQIK